MAEEDINQSLKSSKYFLIHYANEKAKVNF